MPDNKIDKDTHEREPECPQIAQEDISVKFGATISDVTSVALAVAFIVAVLCLLKPLVFLAMQLFGGGSQ